MKRIRIILQYLSIGAIINVAVSLALALWMPVHSPGTLTERTWRLMERAGLERAGHVDHVGGLGIYIVQVHASGYSPISTVLYESGLPWPAMTGWRGTMVDRDVCIQPPGWMTSLDDGLGGRLLPVRPLWFGFIVNALAFAIVAFFTVRLGLRLRGVRRGRRGLCPNCAFDLRGADHDVCPECGSPTGRRRPSASVT